MIGGDALSARAGAFAGRGAAARFSAIRRFGGGAPSGPPLVPLDANLVTIGDSLTAAAFVQNDPGDRAYAGSGFVTWFLLGTAHRLRVRPDGNLAVNGHTLGQIRDSLGANGSILASRAPAVVSVMGGTNNLNDTFSDGQLTSLLGEILALVFASSATLVVVWSVPPARPSSPRTANAERQRRVMNAYLAAEVAARPDRAVFVNLDEAGLGEPDFADAVHPTASGARTIGLAGAAMVASRLEPGFVSARPAPAVYTTNPSLAGGAAVATDWQGVSDAAGGATVAFSKDAQGRQRILVSGSYTGSGRNVSLDQYGTGTALGRAPAEGEALEALLDYELVGTPLNVNTLDVLLGVTAPSYANVAQAQSMLADNGAPLFPTNPGRTVMRSVGVLRKAGAPHFLTTRLIIVLTAAAAATPVSLDLRINRLEFRRIG